jgi:flagellar biogenesis protein FliO
MSDQPVILSILIAATLLSPAMSFAQNTPAVPVTTNAPVSVAESQPETEPQPQSQPAPAVDQPSSEAEPLPAIEQTPLGGRPPVGDPGEQLASGTGVGSWGLQTAMALGVVIALVVLVRLFIRRLHGGGAASSPGLVEVMARVPIAPKTSVLFLRIGQRIIIAGQTQAGLNTLASLDDPDDVAEVLAHVQAAKPASITEGFGKLIKQFDRGYDPNEVEGGDSAEHVVDRARNDVSGLLSRLRSLNRRDNDAGQ